jgi:amino acid adenylation domain-containing protein
MDSAGSISVAASNSVDAGPDPRGPGNVELIHVLFEAHARRNPQALALVTEHASLTYGELNARANKLAWSLRKRGLALDGRVALCAERSADLVTAMLGILKAGGAFVPLDPVHPPHRLAYMLSDSGASLLLTQRPLRSAFENPGCDVMLLEDFSFADAVSSDWHDPDARELGLESSHLVYVIYTSGSTGQPKGVMVEHRNLAYFLSGLEERIHGEAPHCQRVAWNSSFGFDMAAKAWGQLTRGRSVFLVPEAVRLDASAMLSYLEKNRIEAMECTPSHLRALQSAGLFEGRAPALRKLLLGGEPIDAALWKTLVGDSGRVFYNMYGPTECSVDATCGRVTGSRPHIGWIMPGARIHILDSAQQPVGAGETGEIYIGGAGVARGYLNRPELTGQRFVDDPFTADGISRLYRTGDLGRWLDNGAIEYAGRNDHQVKLRGYRIELGEIEARLAEHDAVDTVVVSLREDRPNEKRLVGYVVCAGQHSVTAEELRRHLLSRVPEYMVPLAFVVLKRMPLTANGKIDRGALPAPGTDSFIRAPFEAPEGEVEEMLAAVWENVLGVAQVGQHDNFFDLGGDSLLATRVMTQVVEQLDAEVPLRLLFEHPTVAEMSRALVDELTSEDLVKEAS